MPLLRSPRASARCADDSAHSAGTRVRPARPPIQAARWRSAPRADRLPGGCPRGAHRRGSRGTARYSAGAHGPAMERIRSRTGPNWNHRRRDHRCRDRSPSAVPPRDRSEDTGVAVPILEINPRGRAFVPTQENGCVRRLAVAGRCHDHSDTHVRRREPVENTGPRHHPHGWFGCGERRALRGPRGLLAHEPETRCRHCGRLTWVLRIGSSTPALSSRRRRTCVSCSVARVAAPRDGDCPNPREDSAMTAAPPALAGLPSRPAHRMIPVSRAAPHRVLPDGCTQSLRFVTLPP